MEIKIKEIIRQIVEYYGLNHKTINLNNLELAGTKIEYDTPHNIYYYKMRRIHKTIYFEYDVYRAVAREVMVF